MGFGPRGKTAFVRSRALGLKVARVFGFMRIVRFRV